jgi:hypothetical protein
LTPVKTYDAQSATQDGFGGLTKLPVGMVLAVRPDHSIAGAVNTMGPVDVPVAVTLLTDGDETATVALPASPLAAGGYALKLGFHRWETSVTDQQAVYDDAATVELVL